MIYLTQVLVYTYTYTEWESIRVDKARSLFPTDKTKVQYGISNVCSYIRTTFFWNRNEVCITVSH